jgi:nucleoside-diphosphate-sugar epimerase
MTKVLVTGSVGRIGAAAVADLLEHGYEVIGLDTRVQRGPARTYQANVEDLGEIVDIMHGCDAVIHMAAIPSPVVHAAQTVFRTNVISTFNVLEAAALLGIRKVVMASSVSALGVAFRFREVDVQYAPIDEAHPLLSQDAYGLSKSVGEHIAEGFVRRDPMLSASSLRFTSVFTPEFPRQYVEEQRREAEINGGLWTYVDVRDAGRACRLAMEHTEPGHHPFHITAPQTFMLTPTRDLMMRFFPGIRIADGVLAGTESPFDLTRAEQMLGFRAAYDWQGQPTSGV